MAADAQYRGARSRAPENSDSAAPPQNIAGDAQAIGVEAEAIDAIVLGVETMLEQQRRMMQRENASSFLCDNELWTGIAVLLSMVRHKAVTAGTLAQAIEVAGMRADQPAAA